METLTLTLTQKPSRCLVALLGETLGPCAVTDTLV